MKAWKKLTALLLVAAMVLLPLAGCGKEKETDAPRLHHGHKPQRRAGHGALHHARDAGRMGRELRGGDPLGTATVWKPGSAGSFRTTS